MINRFERVLLKALGTILVLSLFSCISTGTTQSDTAPLTVKLLSKKEVTSSFGVESTKNPYQVPFRLLPKNPFSFVVLKLTLLNDAPVQLKVLEAHILDKENNALGNYYSLEQMKSFWNIYSLPDEIDFLYDKLDKSYLISDDSSFRAGKHNKFFVIAVRKVPLPDEYVVRVVISIDSIETVFEIPFAK